MSLYAEGDNYEHWALVGFELDFMNYGPLALLPRDL